MRKSRKPQRQTSERGHSAAAAAPHSPKRPRSAIFPRADWFCLTLLVLLSVYVLAALTPSSYALVPVRLGVEPAGTVFGMPRNVRSDEWVVWTPYVQTAVRNHFQRYNATSPYHEDLRNYNALPILDWGLAFKPYFWPFFAAPPAYAYSFFFAFQMFAFLYGYRLLFRRLGMADDLAIGGSLLLFFCGFTQYWWTTYGPQLGFFPWVVLALMLPHRWWKYPLLCYAMVAWVIGHAYPMGIIALGFVVLVLIVQSPGKILGGVGGALLTAGAAAVAGLVLFAYYRDVLGLMMHTVYPGDRRIPAGSGVIRMLAGMFWPSFNQQEYAAFGFSSICESGVVGTFLPLSVLAFTDYGSLRKLVRGELESFPRWRAAVLLSGFLLMAAWLFLPIPDAVGKIFLWNLVPAERMMFAFGFLSTLLCLLLLNSCGTILSPLRAGLFFAALVGGTVWSKRLGHVDLAATPVEELVIFGALFVAALLAWWRKLRFRPLVIAACVVSNFAVFGIFNPLQSAKEIFTPKDSPFLAALRKMQNDDPRGWLTAGAAPGAVLNGEGFCAINHVLIYPQLQFFRKWFPDLTDKEFNSVFNRYAHVHVEHEPKARSSQSDVIILPDYRIEQPGHFRKVIAMDRPPGWAPDGTGGALETVQVDGRKVLLMGWVPWGGIEGSEKLYVLSNEPLGGGGSAIQLRLDVAKKLQTEGMLYSGFAAWLERAGNADGKRGLSVCVISENTAGQRALLPNVTDPSACTALMGDRLKVSPSVPVPALSQP
jgi:hypothetical protein